MPNRADDDSPELDALAATPPGDPTLGTDGAVHGNGHGPELDVDEIAAPVVERVLELDDRTPARLPATGSSGSLDVRPAAGSGSGQAPEHRSLIAQAQDSLRSDSARLLRTGLKAAAWLGVVALVLGQGGVFAAVVGGALAGDVVIWFLIRVFELPRHLWAFQLEALVNLGAVWVMVDVMHLFDSFRDPEVLPFGLVAFMLVGLGRFVAWWVPRALEA